VLQTTVCDLDEIYNSDHVSAVYCNVYQCMMVCINVSVKGSSTSRSLSEFAKVYCTSVHSEAFILRYHKIFKTLYAAASLEVDIIQQGNTIRTGVILRPSLSSM
jgi:hypothetical protein